MIYLIKIGGSLIPTYVSKIYHVLREFDEEPTRKIFLFPGGGKFADLIREYRDTLLLGDEITHRMALACLDQNAYLIADICKCKYVSTLQEIREIKEFPVVITPYRLLMEKYPFAEYNLDIDILSSDSSAVYIAYLLKAELIIATDVDGVYDRNPKKTKGKVKLLREISVETLAKIKRGGPLDETVSKLIDKYKVKTWVVNGKYPERIYEIVRNNILTTGTLIKLNSEF